MKYIDALINSMEWLGNKNDTIFLGQSVNYSGNAIFNTLKTVPENKKLETPVFEDMQMGLSIGMALEGFVPITCYPRFDFLILACNQLINHLDKIRFMSNNNMKPRVIIRTSIGSKNPLDGGVQHTQNYTDIFEKMCTEINVVMLDNSKNILPEFQKAYERKDSKSTLLIEHGDYYNDK